MEAEPGAIGRCAGGQTERGESAAPKARQLYRSLKPPRRRRLDQHPIGQVAALQVPLEGPELCGAPILNPFTFRALGSAAELSQETHGHARQVCAHHFRLFQVGARSMQKFHCFGAAFGFASRNCGVEACHHRRRKQVTQLSPVSGGERLDDHFVSALGPTQEATNIESRIPGLNCGQTGEGHPFVRRRRRAVLRALDRRAGGRNSWRILRLTPHASPQHSVELVKYDGREAGEDDQGEHLQR